MLKNFLFYLLLFFTSVSFSQNLKTEGKKIVDGDGNEVLLRGYAPGGWLLIEGYMMHETDGSIGAQHQIKSNLVSLMGAEKTEEFFKKWRENHFTKRDVDSLASWGFNSIRVPLHYNLFTLPIQEEPTAGENTWLEEGFSIVDNVLAWAKPHNMYIILDLHAAPGGQGRNTDISDYDPNKPSLWESEQNKSKTVALWRKIAERYKDNEWIGGYDLLNETNWDLPEGKDLKDLFVRITNAIREVDDKHIIIIEGNDYANNFTGLLPPWDDNMAYSFHKYWNSTNEDDLNWILPIREQYDVPLWMGESGENSNTWYTDAVSLFENNNVGWAWWAMKKIGSVNSPYRIVVNDGYQKILNYWKDEGDKPTEQEAYDAMMKLADNALSENCLYRKGISDALLRQPHTNATLPFKERQVIPGVVYLSDYDLGKNNYAYYDKDVATYHQSSGSFVAWNRGWRYRNDGVDIEDNNDNTNSNGYHLGFVDKGEWTKYSVKINSSGIYRVRVRHASEQTGAQLYLSLNDQNATPILTTNSSGSWFSFINTAIDGVILEEGEHSLKVHFNSAVPVNIISLQFEKTGEISSAPFNSISGKTGSDEKSIEVFLNQEILTSSISGSLDKFTVNVNGEDKNISSVTVSQSKSKTLILNLADNLLYTDEIKVSYSGDLIKSKNSKTLNSFTNLEVVNDLDPRFVVPGKVQVEDFIRMFGLGTEDTTDEGGGSNIGYTDTGDYADYKIFTNSSSKYTVDFRVASESNGGKISLSLVEENSSREYVVLSEVDFPSTGGWQEWTTITANLENNMPKGIFNLRLKVLDGGFNMNWMNFRDIDSDLDGVGDSTDQCPNTPTGSKVDVNGCKIFELPVNNYKVEVASATCIGNSDGVINLIVEDASFDYTVTITGKDNVTITGTNKTGSVTGLAKGTYEVCFTVDGQTNYEQCFEVVVGEPPALTAFIDIDNDKKKTSIAMGGSNIYNVTINGIKQRVSGNTFEANLSTGLSIIRVDTDLECQGFVEKEVFISEDIHYYPNPTENDVNVHVGGKDTWVKVSIFSEKGDLIYTRYQDIVEMSRKTNIDLSNQITGTYIVILESKTVRKTFKVIRE
ncbi:MAG: carbohydrate-binding protein [Flavobacteriaceae bacterium]